MPYEQSSFLRISINTYILQEIIMTSYTKDQVK